MRDIEDYPDTRKLPRMTTEEWLDLWNVKELRRYIIDQAKIFTRNPELQEDLIQEAWLRVGGCENDRTLDYYKNQAFKGMDAHRQAERRAGRLATKGRDFSQEHQATYLRLWRFKKENKKKSQER